MIAHFETGTLGVGSSRAADRARPVKAPWVSCGREASFGRNLLDGSETRNRPS
jgi:hypothetical protein